MLHKEIVIRIRSLNSVNRHGFFLLNYCPFLFNCTEQCRIELTV